jgi:hypothetical protein
MKIVREGRAAAKGRAALPRVRGEQEGREVASKDNIPGVRRGRKRRRAALEACEMCGIRANFRDARSRPTHLESGYERVLPTWISNFGPISHRYSVDCKAVPKAATHLPISVKTVCQKPLMTRNPVPHEWTRGRLVSSLKLKAPTRRDTWS